MKQLMILAMLCCFLLFAGCGSEKKDPGQSKTGEETAAPSRVHPYKQAIDKAKGADKTVQERTERVIEAIEK